MATKVGQFQALAGKLVGEKISVTGLGFTPDAVFFRWTGRSATVDTGPTQGWVAEGYGFMLTNGERGCVSEGIQAGADPYAARAGMWNNQCLVFLSNDGSTYGKADFYSMDSDGFTIEVDERFLGGTFTVMYTAISGKTFKMIEFQEAGSTGNQAYSGAGFEPTFVMILGQGTATYGAPESIGRISIGAAIGADADQQAVFSKFEEHGQGFANTGTYCRRTECLAVMGTDTSVSRRAKLASFDADGFTLNWLERVSTSKFLAVVSDGRWYVGNDNAGFATSSTIDLSGFTWSPEGLFVISACSGESTQNVGQPIPFGNEQGNFSFGMGTGPAERHCLHARYTYDAFGGLSRTTWLHEFDEIFCVVNNAAAPVRTALMDINIAFSPDLIQLIMDDGDAYGSFFFYIAVGPPIEDYRDRLVRYLHNTYQSRRAGRPIIRDPLGRELPPEQVEVDNWIFSGAFGFPTPVKYDNLLEDPNTFYAETIDVSEGRISIGTDRESFLESLIRKMGRG